MNKIGGREEENEEKREERRKTSFKTGKQIHMHMEKENGISDSEAKCFTVS